MYIHVISGLLLLVVPPLFGDSLDLFDNAIFVHDSITVRGSFLPCGSVDDVSLHRPAVE